MVQLSEVGGKEFKSKLENELLEHLVFNEEWRQVKKDSRSIQSSHVKVFLGDVVQVTFPVFKYCPSEKDFLYKIIN